MWTEAYRRDYMRVRMREKRGFSDVVKRVEARLGGPSRYTVKQVLEAYLEVKRERRQSITSKGVKHEED